MAGKRSQKTGRKPRGRTGVRKPRVTLTGTIHVARPGAATVETAEGAFAVVRGGIHEAMSGDEVQVVLVRRGGSEPQAVVVGVVRRATTTLLGIFGLAGPLGVVKPLDGRLRHDFFVLPEDASPVRMGVGEGDVVMARILEYPTRQAAGIVTIERRVGSSAELDLNVEAIIASYGLATEFMPAVLAQADGMKLDVEGALAADSLRLDLRGTTLFTIDPTDARDFDDAVSAWRCEDGYTLQVHIADVTSYLPWDSPMDLEARQRTCSTYLVDRVLPMLPERLCNDLCSLRPGEDRLAMTVTLHLDDACEVLSAEAAPSVIRSRARLDYDTVDRLIAGEATHAELPCEPGYAEEVAHMIACLDEVAQARIMRREERGAVDFETREAKVELDEDGRPMGIQVQARTRATSLVEEAMLLANEAVARMLDDAGMSAAYRVHERPSPEDLAATVGVLKEFDLLKGIGAERLVSGDPAATQAVLAKAHGTRAEYLANALLLRAQKRAVYLPRNDGHYALGARAYCHFTSPIRRYPDVIVHRALKALLAGKGVAGLEKGMVHALPQLCRTCSDRERVADAAARDSQKVKMAEYYAERIGERYPGIVVGVERYGLFVMLDDTCAEGLLPVRSLGEEWFVYDAERRALVGESTGRMWRLGQRVAVEVTDADPSQGQIDFALAGLR